MKSVNQIEKHISQLPIPDQLKLISKISERLSNISIGDIDNISFDEVAAPFREMAKEQNLSRSDVEKEIADYRKEKKTKS